MFDIFKGVTFNHAEADYEQVRVGIGQPDFLSFIFISVEIVITKFYDKIM